MVGDTSVYLTKGLAVIYRMVEHMAHLHNFSDFVYFDYHKQKFDLLLQTGGRFSIKTFI